MALPSHNYSGPYLTTADIEALNAARIVLKAMERNYGNTWGDGVIYAKAETAATAIFDLLNTAKHTAGVEIITSEQIHLEQAS